MSRTSSGNLRGKAAQLDRLDTLDEVQYTAPATRCRVCNEPLKNPRNTICGGCWVACSRLGIDEDYARALIAAWDYDWPHDQPADLGVRVTISGGEVVELDQPAATASADDVFQF
jgi:hypothetical protein